MSNWVGAITFAESELDVVVSRVDRFLGEQALGSIIDDRKGAHA